MKKLRIYCDTSVFGGCFDEEFADASRRMIARIAGGAFTAIVSPTVVAELMAAPERVGRVLLELPRSQLLIQPIDDEVLALRDAYLAEAVVSGKSSADAEHVAAATVAAADLIVSWNFKHIVNFGRIRGYLAVNIKNGYAPIGIFSPMEVVGDEEEDV